ncbi:MAG: hypothetical protein J7641_23900 [Cyanobacteria bacterium SID2]|nr:hypothetical protein [Cyanobacteria bacterium SID2]MBP0003546.1 hypothetical protein [Cyanobacteria bacterium SBC]
MQSDLQGLELTVGELRHLSGIDPSEIFRSSQLRDPQFRLKFLLQEFLTGLALTPILLGFVYLFVIRPFLGNSVIAAIVGLVVIPFTIMGIRWLWRQQTTPKTLVALLEDIDRYHATLKAIDIGDRLSDESPIDTPERQALIRALTLTRDDLVRALKTERILRENRDFLATSPDLFVNNLTALTALQTNHQAGEYAQYLRETLQIGIGVREEMQKLQKRR